MESVINIAIEYQDIFLAGIKITIIISLLACLFGLLFGNHFVIYEIIKI